MQVPNPCYSLAFSLGCPAASIWQIFEFSVPHRWKACLNHNENKKEEDDDDATADEDEFGWLLGLLNIDPARVVVAPAPALSSW